MDTAALRDSVNIGVTAKTQERNMGFGLDNVLCSLGNNDIIRIFSNNARLECSGKKDNVSTFPTDIEFNGTLIEFEISTDSFLQREDIEEAGIG